MRKFAITTTSESGDHYIYFIEHDKQPTDSQIKKWLKKNGNDIDDTKCYEYIDAVKEITFSRI